MLVPIRLDIDWEKVKIRDTFTWNLHDRVVSPDLFVFVYVKMRVIVYHLLLDALGDHSRQRDRTLYREVLCLQICLQRSWLKTWASR
jgi:hypothetical protein